jgi:PKD repeat protein
MKRFFLKQTVLKLAMLATLALPELAGAATIFNYNQYGDVLAGFRKTGVNEGKYELVVDLGSVTNFLKLSGGTTITITNFSTTQLTNAFTDTGNFGKLQWSVFSAFQGGVQTGFWTTPLGAFPNDTLWLTLPGTNVNTQTQPPIRNFSGTQANQRALIIACGGGAAYMSSAVGVTNANNTATLVLEQVSDTIHYLTAYIGDVNDKTLGDFGANNTPLAYTVENTTPASFTSAQRDDFYQLCPYGKTDPITGLTTGSAYFVGYFILNPNGSMTFTRASATGAAPVASFSGTPINGLAPLSVTFTDASTGSITNWIWNLGDGTFVTNRSNTSVNHNYAAGTYTVSLTVNGSGGSSLATSNNYIVVTNATPVAGFNDAPTNIFVTQSVVFTDTSTGSITNWVWNFGDGNSVTNGSNVSVSHAYATAGTYTVSLVVKGAGGSNTNTQPGYVVVYPKPAIGTTKFSGGSLILSGTSGVPGAQYRIKTSANLTNSLANWTPVWTNVFGSNGSFSYTNSTPTNNASFFIMVSP